MLFLAIGDHRRQAVIDEASEVIRDGGAATVVLGDLDRWKADVFPDGVEIIETSALDRAQRPLRLEHFIVFDVPRRLMKAAGRGPLRPRAGRAWKTYERRFAKPVHRRAVARYSRLWPDQRHQQLMAVVTGGQFDYINVTDYLSMPVGARIQADLASGPQASAKICFGIEYAKYRD